VIIFMILNFIVLYQASLSGLNIKASLLYLISQSAYPLSRRA